MTKRYAISGEVPGRRFAVVLDDTSLCLFATLQANSEGSRNVLAAMAIEHAMLAEEKNLLERFYVEVWRRIMLDTRIKRTVQLSWPVRLDQYLSDLSKRLLGNTNRSEVFRIVLAFYAIQHRAVSLQPTGAFQFQFDEDTKKRSAWL